MDIDRFFHGAALELLGDKRSGLTGTGATKATDVFAFGFLAWEVSRDSQQTLHSRLNG